MKNESGLQFTAINSELYREYVFPNGRVRIDNPIWLNVSDNGHRVYAEDGISYYIPKGWILLKWEAKEGEPNFVK